MFGIFLVKVAFWPSVLILPLFAFDFYVISSTNHYTRKARYLPLEEAFHHRLTATQLGFEDSYKSPALQGQGRVPNTDDLSDVPATPIAKRANSAASSPRSPSFRGKKGNSRNAPKSPQLTPDIERPPARTANLLGDDEENLSTEGIILSSSSEGPILPLQGDEAKLDESLSHSRSEFDQTNLVPLDEVGK